MFGYPYKKSRLKRNSVFKDHVNSCFENWYVREVSTQIDKNGAIVEGINKRYTLSGWIWQSGKIQQDHTMEKRGWVFVNVVS